MNEFRVGDRVKIVEADPDWDVTRHRLHTEGTVTRIKPTAYGVDHPVVEHDDGETWAYAPRSLEKVTL